MDLFKSEFRIQGIIQFDFPHTAPPFLNMIQFYFFVSFHGNGNASRSFCIMSIISKSRQTLYNENFRIWTTPARQLSGAELKNKQTNKQNKKTKSVGVVFSSKWRIDFHGLFFFLVKLAFFVKILRNLKQVSLSHFCRKVFYYRKDSKRTLSFTGGCDFKIYVF